MEGRDGTRELHPSENFRNGLHKKLGNFISHCDLFQHDLFYVAPNWTLFDVGRRKNMGSVMLNYSRKEFPKLLLESVHFTSHMFCTCKKL